MIAGCIWWLWSEVVDGCMVVVVLFDGNMARKSAAERTSKEAQCRYGQVMNKVWTVVYF
jgi:hypothetical protein